MSAGQLLNFASTFCFPVLDLGLEFLLPISIQAAGGELVSCRCALDRKPSRAINQQITYSYNLLSELPTAL